MKTKNKLAEFSLFPAEQGTGSPECLNCATCELWRKNSEPFAKSNVPVNWSGKLLIIEGHPTTSKSREMFHRLARKAGMNRDDLAFTYALRCRPPDEIKPTITQIRLCRGFLVRLLGKLRPSRILVTGSTALRSITNGGKSNVAHSRGRELQVAWDESITGFKAPIAYATYHPESVLKGATQYEGVILQDLQRDTLPKLKYPEDVCPT